MIKPKRSAEQQIADEADRRALNPLVSRQTISESQAEPEFQENHRRLKGGAAGARGWAGSEGQMTARTPAPKAEDYSVVPGSLGPRRHFCESAWGPEADRQAKPLIHLAMEGSLLEAYSQSAFPVQYRLVRGTRTVHGGSFFVREFARLLPARPWRASMAHARSHGPLFCLVSGDQPMRVLAILALALSLVGCTGDRIKQGMNSPHGLVAMSVKPVVSV